MKIMAVDPGEKNIGLAISDPTGTIAGPLSILKHSSRAKDSEKIICIAEENSAEAIIVGQSLDEDGLPTYSGRKAARLAAAIRARTSIRICLWDEDFSTVSARNAQIEMGQPKKKRKDKIDHIAAVIILQSYLDSQRSCEE
jgi:putative Holliday junction resolvase